jgi:hypothetical protein
VITRLETSSGRLGLIRIGTKDLPLTEWTSF